MLELLSRQKGLTVHVSPSGTTCYITSMMFYVEIQLEKDGDVMDVKLAHFEEAPVQKKGNKKENQYFCLFKTLGLFLIVAFITYCLNLIANKNNDLVSGIQISGLKLAPLYELIVQSTLKEKCSEDLSTNKSCFFVSLPDHPKHCYFINKGSEKSGLAGALVSKIPFSHPKCVPGVIEILRHQVAYNTLISSCVSEKNINEDDSELLYFEVVPHKNTSFSVFFLHPVKENLACVVIDVVSSREVQCHLHLNPQDPTLNSTDDFIARAVKRQVLLFPNRCPPNGNIMCIHNAMN
ncbi:mediator of RNA polymerase II transcription subunit 1-like [Motacilla alba alba]|uniref:mediator of RNA polymerase II transcription subunit 1-like n=1 Tax=Motacilla alba alba TaxID=1094192 RepID=UPI0018D534F6|nr:mediator of RNA polymerase II transcription subunit 1-like [Motacilla alba alba]